MKGKIIHSQAREYLANILEFMKVEAKNGVPSIPLSNFKARFITATKVSEKTYRVITKEMNNIKTGASTSFSTPYKDRPRESPKSSLPGEELAIIRNIIHSFYLTEKKRPALKEIMHKVQEHGVPFEGGLSTLACVIKRMGFK